MNYASVCRVKELLQRIGGVSNAVASVAYGNGSRYACEQYANTYISSQIHTYIKCMFVVIVVTVKRVIFSC